VYEGHWEDGKKYGRGEMTYADGFQRVYEGDWKDDNRHGKGKMTFACGCGAV